MLEEARGGTVPAAVQSDPLASFLPVLFICVQGKALEKICWSIQRLHMTLGNLNHELDCLVFFSLWF